MSAAHFCVSYSIDNLPDEIFYFTLSERRHDILALCSHWSNPLATTSRFNCQIREASALAESLLGGHPRVSLFWLNPTAVKAPEEENVNLNMNIGSQEAPCELEHAIFADFLANDSGCHEEDAGDDQLTIATNIIWEIPEVCFILPYLRN